MQYIVYESDVLLVIREFIGTINCRTIQLCTLFAIFQENVGFVFLTRLLYLLKMAYFELQILNVREQNIRYVFH